MASRRCLSLSAVLKQANTSAVAIGRCCAPPPTSWASCTRRQPKKTMVRICFSTLSTSSFYQTRKSHCATCTCPEEEYDDYDEEHVDHQQQQQQPAAIGACGKLVEVDPVPTPAVIQEPKFCFHRRVLDTTLLTPLSTSLQGRQYLLEALQQHTAAAYWQLVEHGVHQSDPAYCGITTLLVVLNSMCIDPNIRWRGGWRYFGSEDTLLQQCCLSPARIQRIGIDLEEFAQLATCHGLQVQWKRPNDHNNNNNNNNNNTLQDFRNDVQRLLTEPNEHDLGAASSVVVVSFSRQSLRQTGDGHFSPLAAYHAATDQVLVMDVARFKYAPYWVPLPVLYEAMIPHDPRTKQSRGWFLLHPPPLHSTNYRGRNITDEASRPAHLVPKVILNPNTTTSEFSASAADELCHQEQQFGSCPINKLKVEYCHVGNKKS